MADVKGIEPSTLPQTMGRSKPLSYTSRKYSSKLVDQGFYRMKITLVIRLEKWWFTSVSHRPSRTATDLQSVSRL